MIRLLGLLFVFLSCYSLSQQFDIKSFGMLIFGLFLICSEGIFAHLMFVEREKVRARYRSKR